MTRLAEVPPYGTVAWRLARARGLGASEIAATLGISPYAGGYEVALEKKGLVEPGPETPIMRWGHMVEPLIIALYEEQLGVTAVRGETWHDERWPHLWATLDGRVGRVGVEVKSGRWSTPPEHVVIQALSQIGLADLERVDVVTVQYGEPVIHPVERDDALIEDILGAAEAWWARYVEGDELPPPDGSRAGGRYLSRLRGEATREPTPDQVDLARRYLAARADRDELGTRVLALRDAIKASMAGVGVLSGAGIRVTWSSVKGRSSVDWKRVAEAYRAALESMDGSEPAPTAAFLDAITSLYTTVDEPSDRLEVKEAKEEDS